VRAELEAGGQRDVATHDGAIRRRQRQAEHGAALVELDGIVVRDPADPRGRLLGSSCSWRWAVLSSDDGRTTGPGSRARHTLAAVAPHRALAFLGLRMARVFA
jgi:hypothetical protein